MYYLNRPQLSHAGELNAISRSLCVLGIGIGKISVAFLIERFAGPSKWRRWLLRSISISIAVSAIITVTLFYVQCQPVRAVWDKSLVKAGKAKCWDPVPLNKYVLPSAIEFLCPLDGPFFDGTTKVSRSHRILASWMIACILRQLFYLGGIKSLPVCTSLRRTCQSFR